MPGRRLSKKPAATTREPSETSLQLVWAITLWMCRMPGTMATTTAAWPCAGRGPLISRFSRALFYILTPKVLPIISKTSELSHCLEP